MITSIPLAAGETGAVRGRSPQTRRRLAAPVRWSVLLWGLVGLAGCRREAPAPDEAPAAGSTARDVGPAAGDAKGEPTGETGETGEPFDPADPGVPVDDATRFVMEDLARFMADHPQVLRKQDVARMRTCSADACLPEAVHASVTPYHGAGVRYLVPLWLRGCLTGSARACLLAGRSYQSSGLASPDEGQRTHVGWTKDALQERFRRYIARACDLSAAHCESWADFLLDDPSPAPQDVGRAIERLVAGCDRNEAGSCAALARHADRHAAIGDAGPWWRRACEHDSQVPSASCAGYAEHLLASGKAEDRAAAAAALGPVCDPSSALWKSQCSGDAAEATEACDSTYFSLHAFPCVELARDLPPDQALRVQSALCVTSVVTDTNALARRACTEAVRLAEQLGRPASHRETLRRRACEVAETECVLTTFELDACARERERCVEGG